MEKIKLTTTLNLLKEHEACDDGYELLIKHIGEDYDENKPINLLTILESNGAEHCIWALRAVEQKNVKQAIVFLSCKFAESVLHIFEDMYQEDKRPRQAINASTACVLIPTEENATVARNARNAAVAASSDADAAFAASAAAAAVAFAAADAADADADADAAVAASAAADAADAADAEKKERKKQAEILKKYLIN
jgi:hypothetical protein